MSLQDFARRWGAALATDTSTKPLDVMVDIDDVLFGWADGIHERCRQAGLHDGVPYSRWEMWEDYGCDKDTWLEVVTRATHDGFYLEPPMHGSVEQLRRLMWHGHNIHLVTARGFMALADDIRAWTRQWVEEYAVPHRTLTFAKDKVAAQHELGVEFHLAVDDGAHNYEALDNAGIEVYLLDRPHNRNHDAERRIHSVAEFVDIALAKGEQHG